MADSAKKKAKQHRINPTNFWRLKKKLDEMEKEQKAYREWCEAAAEKRGMYADEVNFVTGVVTKVIGMTELPNPKTGRTEDVREFVKRLPIDDKDVVAAKVEFAKIVAAGEAAEKVLNSTAEL